MSFSYLSTAPKKIFCIGSIILNERMGNILFKRSLPEIFNQAGNSVSDLMLEIKITFWGVIILAISTHIMPPNESPINTGFSSVITSLIRLAYC